MSAHWIDWRSFAQFGFKVEGIVYQGASAFDTSSEEGMLRALFEPLAALMDGLGREQV
jgi:hypothetical protein